MEDNTEDQLMVHKGHLCGHEGPPKGNTPSCPMGYSLWDLGISLPCSSAYTGMLQWGEILDKEEPSKLIYHLDNLNRGYRSPVGPA